MELSDAKTLDKLFKSAIRVLITELGAERAAVVLGAPGAENPPALAVYGMDADTIWSGREVPVAVLRQAMKGQPVMVLDADKDPAIKDSRIKARSIVCVPLNCGGSQARGLLYTDHKEPGKLDYTFRDKVVKLGREFDRQHVALCAAGAPLTDEDGQSMATANVALGVAGFCMFLLVAYVIYLAVII